MSKTLNVFSTAQRLSSGVDCQDTLLFFLWCRAPTISEHDFVYTLSNNRRLHQATTHLQIIHVRWVKLLCVVHCLKGSFEKTAAPPQTENNIEVYKIALRNRFRPIFPLKNSSVAVNCIALNYWGKNKWKIAIRGRKATSSNRDPSLTSL